MLTCSLRSQCWAPQWWSCNTWHQLPPSHPCKQTKCGEQTKVVDGAPHLVVCNAKLFPFTLSKWHLRGVKIEHTKMNVIAFKHTQTN